MTGTTGPEPSGVEGRTRAVDSVRPRALTLVAISAVIVGAAIYRAATAPGEPAPTEVASEAPTGPVVPGEPSNSTETSATPAISPTIEPEPTPIVGPAGERPGVPDSIKQRWWIGGVPSSAFWPTAGDDVSSVIAGFLGSTAFIVLPPGERGIGADDGRVVSYVRGDNTSTILVRSFDDGSLIRTIETPFIVRDGLLVGDHLFWSGVLLDGTTLLDAGTASLDLSTANAQPIQIVEPLEEVDRFGDTFDYDQWVVDDTGDTAVTWFGNGANFQAYVIDVQSGSVRAALVDAVPRGVTNEAILVSESGMLTLQDLNTGAPLWAIETPQDTNGILTTPVPRDGEFIVGFEGDGPTYVIAAISLQTGAIRDLVVQPAGGADTLYLAPSLSSADDLVLLPDLTLSEAFGDTGEFSASLLDPDTGEIIRDVFSIGHTR